MSKHFKQHRTLNDMEVDEDEDQLPLQQAVDQVKQFMQATGQVVNEKPTIIDGGTEQLRDELIAEEYKELQTAMFEDHPSEQLVSVADALAKLLYVVLGTAVSYGIPIAKVFEEVHRSNMTKLVPLSSTAIADTTRDLLNAKWRTIDSKHAVLIRDDGKVLKPDGYEPPRIKEILERYQ